VCGFCGRGVSENKSSVYVLQMKDEGDYDAK